MKYNMYDSNNNSASKRKHADPIDEISSKSQSIKANLKFKYMLHKLEKTFFSKEIL